ncbi:MAG: SDR family oxidoreductase [Thermoanaerobaculia bacterium]
MMTAGFETLDRTGAENFATAAPSTLRKVIYLGGLLPKGEQRSKHLRSHAEVGTTLARSVPVLEFRAGPIIGSGSASFEMVRYLTERLPAMVAPRWIDNEVQPIAIDDVLRYLVGAVDRDETGVVEIGADRLTFRQMMQSYASIRGLRRFIVPVPVLAPRIAGLWVGLVTPIPNSLAVPLIEGIVEPVLADTTRARALMPEIVPMPYRDAVSSALERSYEAETRWSGAQHSPNAVELTDREGAIREVRSVEVDASPARVFEAFTSLGGRRGWLAWNAAWWLRGALDRLVGGPGLRRGRRHPQHLLPGEALDFWRVDAIEPDKLLRLRAEMKVPGAASLQWEVSAEGPGSRLIQTAMFVPRGLAGALYWYFLYPIHALIFSDLAKAIAREAEGREALSSTRVA